MNADDRMMPAVSVCICTYNRAESLRRTLTSLAAQAVPSWSACEILVVDNNCSDHTTEVVASFAGRLPIRRAQETAQGLAHARNRALEESRGGLIVFTDDDIVFESGWLAAYLSAVESYPDAGYFGGRMLPDWQGGKPAWHLGESLELIDGLLGWYDLGEVCRMLTSSDPTPFGANFAIRRKLAEAIGPFRTDLGVRGESGGRGEETEFFLRARRAGARGAYLGNVLCWHAVEPRRFALRALYRYGIECGKAHRKLVDQDLTGSNTKAVMYLLKGVLQILKGRSDRFRQCVINAGIQRGLRQSARSVIGTNNSVAA